MVNKEYFVRTFGGKNCNDHVTRTLARIFSEEFAVQCTWTGSGKNKKTKVGDFYY